MVRLKIGSASAVRPLLALIPLLLGIGVDSGIHLLQRAKRGDMEESGLLGTSTARAVYYSALTTGVSFGSLSFAGHNGLASLGVSLSFGLFCSVMSVLVVLPALMAPWRSAPRAGA